MRRQIYLSSVGARRQRKLDVNRRPRLAARHTSPRRAAWTSTTPTQTRRSDRRRRRKKKIKDLESVVETETAAKTALETKLRELALEHEALKAKNAPPSTLGSFFGF